MSDRTDYMLRPFLKDQDVIQDRVQAGIEANRKGRIFLRLVDADGKPVTNAKVSVQQTSHDFHYGANLFMLDEFESEEKNARYREVFKDHFNFATLPFYWDTLEPEEGKPRYDRDSPKVYRRPAPDLCLEYCEQFGITPKAHCLHYDHFEPKWLQKYTVEDQWKILEQRFRQCAERYAGRIHGWEVTNESFWQSATTQMYTANDFMERSFAMAARHFPNNELISNEGQECFRTHCMYSRMPYLMQLERAILKGARIDTIGIQYHIWCSPDTEEKVVAMQCSPRQIYEVLDCYWETFHRPMQMTEITFPCHDPNSKEAEDIQAEYVRQLYSIFFSHPAMEAIIYWNLVDGYAYGATPGDFTNGENKLAGGLMHFDITPKPALTAIRKLFTETWRTNADIHTDDDGRTSLRGFYGAYQADIVTPDGRTATTSFRIAKDQRFRDIVTLTI